MALLQNIFPILFLLGLFVGENRITFPILEFLEDNLDARANLQFAQIGKFIGRDNAFSFAADIDDYFIGADFSDNARDDGAFLQLIEGALGEQVLH